MRVINLKDNRRYFIEEEIEEKYKLNKSDFDALFNFTSSYSNKLDNKNFELLNSPKDKSFILQAGYKNEKPYIQTGNMVGKFYYKKTEKSLYEVNIGLRFDKENSNDTLEYLLDYSDALYTKSIDLNSKQKSKKNSNKVVETILTKMFMNSLSKAIVMGLPTIYQEEYENSYDFKGKVDINQFISKETPFKGKVPHIKNEKVVVRSIASVILKAIDIIYFKTIDNFKSKYKVAEQKNNQDELNESLKNISLLLQVKNHIKQSITPMIITKQVINEALSHKILKHPSFYEYKNSIKLAAWVLEGFKEPKIDQMKGESFGYLCDVSRLWENFLVRLIKDNISDEWEVFTEPPGLMLFGNMPQFSNRREISNSMKPDIIIKHKFEKKVMVIDAKFKSSKWFNREDFYKTVSYISYYQNNGYKVVLSGQTYPDQKLADINDDLKLFDSDLDFRLFGINLHDYISKSTYREKIKEFINRNTSTKGTKCNN